MTLATIQEIKFLSVGESILYRNKYDQLFTGKIVRKYLDDFNRLFFFVKRADWGGEECLPFSEFQSGNYQIIK